MLKSNYLFYVQSAQLCKAFVCLLAYQTSSAVKVLTVVLIRASAFCGRNKKHGPKISVAHKREFIITFRNHMISIGKYKATANYIGILLSKHICV